MNAAAKPLEPLAFPLTGSQLIEASAGTGKTFTIAMLYVRLVLGHGDAFAFKGGRLTPPEILVVTFTETATQELRDRIRSRLAVAAAYFRGDTSQPLDQQDPLHELRAQYQPVQWPACARQLELAAEWMDEAAVSTIHGWCNRMLREHAFDSLSLFSQRLEADLRALRSEVIRDYWRTFYYPLTQEEAEQIQACWESPAELEKAMKNLWDHTSKLPDAAAPAQALLDVAARRRMLVDQLKQPWAAWAQELSKLLGEAHQAKRLNGVKLRPDYYEPWLKKIGEWATTDEESLTLTTTAWNRLSPGGIADAWNGDHPLDHPALHELDRVRQTLASLPRPNALLLSHAVRWVTSAFEAAQKRQAQMGFNDLLTGLDTALGGPNGPRLAEVIRQQFPVALIDEFQDTDPVQYRIFDRVYNISASRDDCALILIGDPKQAIYAFRGADIHTYLKARTAVGGRLYTLGTNFRSTTGMVRAANHCFNVSEQRADSAGAFLFRRTDRHEVPFLPVKGRGLKDSFQIDGHTPPAITLAVLDSDQLLSKTAYIEQMSDISATQIVRWLQQGDTGQAGFAGPDTPWRPVKPGDMAILVNNGDEARQIRLALARRGIRSVYLSDKGTVYATRQAIEVYRWLVACAEPDDDRLLRAALSTASLGLSFADLESLQVDEEAWESRVVQFKGYRETWQAQGVLPMIRRILFDFGCAERLLKLDADSIGQSGERILTDLLHLAELLQRASDTLEGEHALIRFLAEQMADLQSEADDKRLRLESDADLVKVITIHKSKGLEYPLVFLPFICATRLTKVSDVPLKWHDAQGEPQVSLEASEDVLAGAESDRLGEDIRKLYVALTRARYQTWLGLAPLETTTSSAIGHLFGLETVDAGAYLEQVRRFAQPEAELQVLDTLETNDDRFTERSPAPVMGKACQPEHRARERWWISSYSGLKIEGVSALDTSPPEESPRSDNLLEGRREEGQSDPVTSRPPLRGGHPMHQFPKGAKAGVFLHDLMEWAANHGFDKARAMPAELREMIDRRCKPHRWDAWGPALCDWVRQMLTTPLPAGNELIRLGQLRQAKAEMEFWFEARHVDLGQLDAAVIRHTLSGRPRPGLTPDTLHGMLKGFMDLVFEHEGRYFVADYKSNWLGATDEAYTPHAMDEAIRSSRYDLQYVIYLFALHRLLKSRLPDYDYDQHMGGALYLFLRGIASPTAGVHFERPPKALFDTLDTLFAGPSEVSA